jgi:hypothetical protein
MYIYLYLKILIQPELELKIKIHFYNHLSLIDFIWFIVIGNLDVIKFSIITENLNFINFLSFSLLRANIYIFYSMKFKSF